MNKIVQGVLFALLLLGATTATFAADFTVRNLDAGSDSGLSDPQAIDPVDGNPGTTLGAQRRNALLYAIRIVASRIQSPVTIRIDASATPDRSSLPCQRNAATLGLGGATNYTANFPGAPQSDVVYPIALADALAERHLFDGADIRLFLNGKLDAGDASCLRGSTWYYGLTGEPGDDQIGFVSTVVHEFIHGLGFQSLVALTDNADTPLGAFPVFRDGKRFPDVFSTYIQDLSFTGEPLWPDLSQRNRADSLDNAPFVVWSSAVTNNSTSNFLSAGRTDGRIRLYAPENIQPGSSISHWSPAVTPNQIMEPYEAVDSNVFDGLGLAMCALRDIGWALQSGVRCPDTDSQPVFGDADGQFVQAYARQTARQSSVNTESADAGGDDDGGSGGGGCTLKPGQPFDPAWAVLCLLAVAVLVRRRSLTGG